MADEISKLRDAWQEGIERVVDSIGARLGATSPGANLAPLNPLGTTTIVNARESAIFATGYSGGQTVMAFTADISEAGGGGGFNGTDVVTL